ncbi:vWA domain-containing protein [Aureimonas psammosilenae]|uniref:vWA domain-containing protein n=1 Tax=Aureimonas psammosilenae TaxID=2495496 RepID=UPI00126092B1|nr:vWA domain-containing protein [Aureimonas psammosilenae]
MSSTLARLLASALLVAFLAVPAGAAEREALHIENKRMLYQRVVTKPGARLLASSSAALESGRALAPFEVFYVFGRQGGRVEVGGNARGNPTGWIEAEATVDWKHSVVAAFNNRAEVERQRQLFFATKSDLQDTIGQEGVLSRIAALREAAASGGDSAPVVAIEPNDIASIDDNFYLLPILDFEKSWLHFDAEGTLLEVGSVTKGGEASPPPRREPRAGVMFVVDTTVSMQPYIDRTREAILRIKDRLATPSGSIHFGLIGFRQPVENNPGIEYDTRIFQPLTPDSRADDFLAEIGAMRTARVSTRGFNEDSLGGLFEALDSTDWSQFDLRYVVLITDAGPRRPERGNNRSGALDVDEINELARKKGVRVVALHLKTPDGRPDHEPAETAYRRVSATGGASLYTGIAGSGTAAFAAGIDPAAEQIAADLRTIAEGRLTEAPSTEDQSAAAQIARASRAMQLDYLGRRVGGTAPQFYRAWTIDRDFEEPAAKPALDIRVMLTKNQLSTLSEALRRIVERGATIDGDPLAFFRDLRDVAARSANDPRQLAENAPLGAALDEYLADLPYTSQILNLTPDDWVVMPASQQRDRILDLKSKLEFFERVHNDPRAWTRLQDDATDGESVTTISIDRLP